MEASGHEVGDAGAGLARQLIGEALGLRDAELPRSVLEDAVARVVDIVGVGLAGASTPVARAAATATLRRQPDGPVTIWGRATGGPAETAAMVNATAAHALDYDDSFLDTVLHVGSIIVPVALAVGEEEARGGIEVLRAIACGYQLADYLGKLGNRRFQPRGFQATAVLGVFAGAITAGYLRGLPEQTLVDAFGICGGFASGLMEFMQAGGDTKPLQVGWAAHAALVALSLAEAGARGAESVLEGTYGVFRSFVGTGIDADQLAGAPFWGDYAVSRVVTKYYPVCHAIHAPADAWTEIVAAMRTSGLDPVADAARISCRIGRFGGAFVLEPRDRKLRPRTAGEARFSLPYCMARIALDGELDLDSFSEAALEDPRAGELAARIEYGVLDADEERAALAVVEAETSEGTLHRRVVGHGHSGELRGRLAGKVTRALRALGTERQALDLIDGAQAILADDTLVPFLSALRAFASTAGAAGLDR